MAKQLIVLTHCDMCLMEDPTNKVTATVTELLAFGDMRERKEIDLCAEHGEDYLEPLRQVVKVMGHSLDNARGNLTVPDRPKAGTRAGWSKAAPQEEPECFLCGHKLGTKAGIEHHMRQTHHLTVSTLYGATCPLCGKTYKGGLGIHTIRSHNLRTVGAFQTAEAAGDPHGVVEMARKRAEAAQPQVQESA